jgi:hypothetical protein
MYVHARICKHSRMQAGMHTQTYTHMNTRICADTKTHTCASVRRMQTCMQPHTHTHTHTHTHKPTKFCCHLCTCLHTIYTHMPTYETHIHMRACTKHTHMRACMTYALTSTHKHNIPMHTRTHTSKRTYAHMQAQRTRTFLCASIDSRPSI